MTDALANPSSRRAVVVAHPDDETLWCGGLMIRYPGDWTVICCSTPKRDPIRAQKFHAACIELGAAKSTIYWRTETRNEPLLDLDAAIGDLSRFDLVVTHNKEGEYGHPHHKQVHQYVTVRRPDALTIGYGGEGSRVRRVIELADSEWEQKLRALKSYDHLMSWGGRFIPTWQALLTEYGTPGKYHGFNLRRETYDQ
jgi:LmbE family N-acetylglucosaminyl deacetylase